MADSIEVIEKLLSEIKREIARGIVGQTQFVEGLLIALLADGNVLIEGVPGLAKTRAVHLLSQLSSLDFKRLQFTPDLLPADIIGTRIYNQKAAGFETKLGPLFANFILADEINRAPAKVQSALLEAMQERQVTIGDTTFQLPRPFFVYATMNPVEQEGTYKLPEAQLDRFLLKLVVEYPSQEEETSIVQMVLHEVALPVMKTMLDGAKIEKMQNVCRKIHIEKNLLSYITDIVAATRDPQKYKIDLEEEIAYGASPRASISLAKAGQARALMSGRDFVTPDDIKGAAHAVLRHRIIPSYLAEADGLDTDSMITTILDTVKVP